MKKILKLAAIAAGVAMCWSCCLDMDYDYEKVVPPTPSLDSPSVVGYITDKAGNPIAGAIVKVGPYTATTDANGYYIIPNVNGGDYDVTVTADGYVQHNGEVTVDAGTGVFVIVKYSTTLASNGNRTTITLSATGYGKGTITSEHLKANDPAGIEMIATINSGTAPQGVQFYLIPIYDEDQEDVIDTKADVTDEERLLIGVTLACSDPNVKLNAPIEIELVCDVALTKQVSVRHLKSGVWREIPSVAKNGVITISATELGTYALFLPFVINEKVRKEELVLRPQSVWDNLYGSGAITAESVSFTYSAGTRINSTATDVLSALLIEKLAYHYGAVHEQLEGTCPLDIRLPIGTRLDVYGTQDVTDAIVSYSTWSVNGTFFGDTQISTKITNRQHNGGNGGRY